MRVLAPLAVVVFAIACLFAISSQGDDAKVASPASETSASSTKSTTSSSDGATKVVTRKTYVVKAGDSFSAIAEQVGVDVDTLQELNPEIDPRALQPGQKLKLKQ